MQFPNLDISTLPKNAIIFNMVTSINYINISIKRKKKNILIHFQHSKSVDMYISISHCLSSFYFCIILLWHINANTRELEYSKIIFHAKYFYSLIMFS